MKTNIFLLIITIALTTLIGYSVYSYSVDVRKVLSTAIFSVTFLIYTGILLGFRINYDKANFLKNTVSILFIFYSLIISYIFIRVEYSTPFFLLINMAPLLIYITIIYFLNKSKF